ncbi:hypothetical protein [Kitasatospora sp. McL0602]|uniref:hypothetical protein n=1 Tax=Kitasatospora sp. McL0602 TaxID=3439530 RepID=UPI003F8B1D1B
MPVPRSIDSWQQVESRQGFAAHLWFLARDSERACLAPDSRAPAARRWAHRSIDSFLRGWGRVLDGLADGTEPPYGETTGQLGWQGLARQLDTARATPPGSGPVLADPAADSDSISDEVTTATELRRYLDALAADFLRDEREQRTLSALTARGGWAHHALPSWLGAWSAWVAAESPLHAELEPVTWRSVALQLSAARVYE